MDGESVDAVSESPNLESANVPEPAAENDEADLIRVLRDIRLQNQTDSTGNRKLNSNDLARSGLQSFLSMMKDFPGKRPDVIFNFLLMAKHCYVTAHVLFVSVYPEADQSSSKVTTCDAKVPVSKAKRNRRRERRRRKKRAARRRAAKAREEGRIGRRELDRGAQLINNNVNLTI